MAGCRHYRNHKKKSRLGFLRRYPAERVILAIGHSARQTFQLLDNNGILLAPKPFSIGVRIEHLQSRIDYSQYGSSAGHPQLPPADYQLSCHLPSGRSVYTFCMCPGGQVVAAASETGGVVTNGMSYHARNQANANSALLVGVQPEDFPTPDRWAASHGKDVSNSRPSIWPAAAIGLRPSMSAIFSRIRRQAAS